MTGFPTPTDVVRETAGISERLRFAQVELAYRRRFTLEFPHTVGQPGEPAFYSSGTRSWSNYGGGRFPVGFSRDPNGFVQLRGSAHSNAASTVVADTTIFVLPASFRPAYKCVFATTCVNWVNLLGVWALTFPQSVVCTVLTTGEVKVDGRDIRSPQDAVVSDKQMEWVTLDGLDFHAPQAVP